MISLMVTSFSSCEEMMDLKPDNEILEKDALQNKEDITALLNSAYQSLKGSYGGRFQRYSDLIGDDVVPVTPSSDKRINIYKRYTTGYFTADDMYNEAYVSILRANLVLENINSIEDLTSSEVETITGEAKFIRALGHYAVLRLFAQPSGFTSADSHLGIGVKTNSDVKLIARSTVSETYTQIEKDLLDAESALGGFTDKAYASKWAAKALLADVYFQMHNYDKAYTYATEIITDAGLVPDTHVLQKGASKDETLTIDGIDIPITVSQETIFQLVSNEGVSNVAEDFGVYRSDNDNIPDIRVSSELYQLATANSTDQRSLLYEVKNAGLETQYFASRKYNRGYANVPILYLTQMKFIQAESAILKTNPEKGVAIDAINSISERAYGNPDANLAPDASTGDILNVIRYEKRLELALEGNRVYDLKRRGAGGESNLEIRGVPWNYVGLALQFPNNEINELFLPNPEAN